MATAETTRATLALLVRAAVNELKTLGVLDSRLWSACLGMFRGEIDLAVFLDIFIETIAQQMTRAWNEGARSVNVDPDEMTTADAAELRRIIEGEYNHVLQLASDVQRARETNMPLDKFRGVFHSRVALWANRYRDTVNAARVWFGGKSRLGWVLGYSDKHCPSCSALAGIVAWADEWAQVGVRPQNPPNKFLRCGGWGCTCNLLPTNQRRSPRALARIHSMLGA